MRRRLWFSLLTHCSFFPPYTEDDLLQMEYSLAARLHIVIADDFDARKLFHFMGLLEKDLIEEKKLKDQQTANAARANRKRV